MDKWEEAKEAVRRYKTSADVIEVQDLMRGMEKHIQGVMEGKHEEDVVDFVIGVIQDYARKEER